MITRFLSEVSATFNPFSPHAKSARSFLALLPSNARSFIKMNIKVLPRHTELPPSLQIGFKDGHKLDLDLEKTSLKSTIEQVDRHSRALTRKAELTDS